MKKITVFSFYNSNNIGDLLIADIVSQLFSDLYNCRYCDISTFEYVDISEWREYISGELPTPMVSKGGIKKFILNSELFRSVIGVIKAERSKAPYLALKNCEGSDLVVFAGGNSLMELEHFPASLKVLYRAVKLLKENGKQIAFCFCGAGPFRSKSSFKMFGNILGLLDFVSVRDDASYDLVKKACKDVRVEVWRDPVLLKEILNKNNKPIDIGVNVYFGHEKKNKTKMKKAFVSLLKELRRSVPERKIYLFSSELTDINDITDVKKEFCDDGMIQVRTINSIDGLFSFYDEVCCVVGTRMHTIITATVSHKPVVAISWQSKVASLMDFLGKEKLCFDMNRFISEPFGVCEVLVDLLYREDEVIYSNDIILNTIRQKNKENINKFRERF